jgi:hypothetical protein
VTDTTISTDPTTLRDIAGALDSWATLVSQGYEVPAATRTMWTVRDTLRAIAAEKEAQAGAAAMLPEPSGVYRPIIDALFDLNPDVSHATRADAVLSAITAAGYEIRPRAYTAGESLGGGLVAVPAPERPVIQCARCAGKGEFLDTTYDRTGEMVWCRPCHGTGKMLDDRDVKAALAALTEKGERS